MQVVSFTEARNNLKAIFDDVYHNDEEVIVHRKNSENVAIISMQTFNQLTSGHRTDPSLHIREPKTGYGKASIFARDQKEFHERLVSLERGKESAVAFDAMWDSIDAELDAP